MILTFKTKAMSVNKMYRGRRFSTKEGLATKESFQWEAKAQWKHKPIAGEVKVNVEFHVQNKRSDLDNLLKGFLDSMTGILYEDDRQISEIHAKRFLSKEPRILLQLITK